MDTYNYCSCDLLHCCWNCSISRGCPKADKLISIKKNFVKKEVNNYTKFFKYEWKSKDDEMDAIRSIVPRMARSVSVEFETFATKDDNTMYETYYALAQIMLSADTMSKSG